MLVKTSILSPKWRYQWTAMTLLVFDEIPDGSLDDQKAAEIRLAKLCHTISFTSWRPYSQVKVTTSYLRMSTDIDQWLRVISRKDIEELILGGNWICINSIPTPSHLFLVKDWQDWSFASLWWSRLWNFKVFHVWSTLT